MPPVGAPGQTDEQEDEPIIRLYVNDELVVVDLREIKPKQDAQLSRKVGFAAASIARELNDENFTPFFIAGFVWLSRVQSGQRALTLDAVLTEFNYGSDLELRPYEDDDNDDESEDPDSPEDGGES